MRKILVLPALVLSLTMSAQEFLPTTDFQIFNELNAPFYSNQYEIDKAEAERLLYKKLKVKGQKTYTSDGILFSESIYDNDGFIKQVIFYSKVNNITQVETIQYTYENGKLSQLSSWIGDNRDGWMVYKYDENLNNIDKLDLTYTKWDYTKPGLFGLGFELQYFYSKFKFTNQFDANNKLITQEQNININDIKYTSLDKYRYDKKGNVEQIARFINNDTINVYSFRYDGNNNKIEETWRVVKPGKFYAANVHRIFKYDHRNLLKQYITKDETGKTIVDLKVEYIRMLSNKEIITETVQDNFYEWQKKGKFETTQDYQARMTEENRTKQAQIFTQQAINKLGKEKYPLNPTQMDYDADNQIFKIFFESLSPIYLKVPIQEAEAFEQNKETIKFEANYTFDHDSIALLSCNVVNSVNGKTYVYDSKQDIAFNSVKLDLNFDAISVDLASQPKAETQQVKEQTKSITVGKSDVDINIPENTIVNDKTFVVIMANENYQKEVPVKFAANDGRVFKQYCEKTLGIPSQNIHLVIDATYGNMKSEMKWISDVTKAFNGESKIIFYYAGHGMPNEQTKSAYLLPVDGFSSDFETAIKLDDLYKKLTEFPSKNVTVFLDACFSGSQRDNGMLAEARGVKIRPIENSLLGQSVVFSAASGDETAYPFKDKQHGLFTYFILKKLQETKGDVTYSQLFDYIKTNVNQQSVVVNQKSQTPQIRLSAALQDSWTQLKLK